MGTTCPPPFPLWRCQAIILCSFPPLFWRGLVVFPPLPEPLVHFAVSTDKHTPQFLSPSFSLPSITLKKNVTFPRLGLKEVRIQAPSLPPPLFRAQSFRSSNLSLFPAEVPSTTGTLLQGTGSLFFDEMVAEKHPTYGARRPLSPPLSGQKKGAFSPFPPFRKRGREDPSERTPDPPFPLPPQWFYPFRGKNRVFGVKSPSFPLYE